jgi:hypothetical protein
MSLHRLPFFQLGCFEFTAKASAAKAVLKVRLERIWKGESNQGDPVPLSFAQVPVLGTSARMLR